MVAALKHFVFGIAMQHALRTIVHDINLHAACTAPDLCIATWQQQQAPDRTHGSCALTAADVSSETFPAGRSG